MLLIQSKTNLRDDNPVKNTCPLDSTSLTLFSQVSLFQSPKAPVAQSIQLRLC